MVDLHPKFLETIKEVYPLAVLGSLCIAIAAFTKESYPEAQTYALTAASLFLISFVLSFMVKLLSSEAIVFISYSSTALGTIMLFLVVIEFSRTVPLLRKTMSLIPYAFTILIVLAGCHLMIKLAMRTKSNLIFLFSEIGLGSGVLFVCSVAIDLLRNFLGIELLPVGETTFICFFSMFSLVATAFIVGALYKKQKKHKRS